MKGLSDSTGYAIAAMSCLIGENGELPSRHVADIAATAGVPPLYLAKLIQRLADSGLIKSRRGKGGGVRLARPPAEICVLEIAEAIEKTPEFNRCLLGLECCSDERACPTHAFWKGTRERIRQTLRNTSLADVATFEKTNATPRAFPAVADDPEKQKCAPCGTIRQLPAKKATPSASA